VSTHIGRKLLYVAALSLSAGLNLAASPARATNNNNVSIPLSGSVAMTCTVADSATGATTSFSDLTQGASGVLIGTITETCNDRNGYKVTLATTNNANFKGASSNTLVPYSLSYNSNAVTFSSGNATITPSGTLTGPSGVAKPLNITFASGFYVADSYLDTITVTMASN
jgi:hypothetical protein